MMVPRIPFVLIVFFVCLLFHRKAFGLLTHLAKETQLSTPDLYLHLDK